MKMTRKTNNDRSRTPIYAIAGVYLIYLAYQMLQDLLAGSVSNQVLTVIFAVIFGLFGLAMVILSIWQSWKQSKKLKEARISNQRQELNNDVVEPEDEAKAPELPDGPQE